MKRRSWQAIGFSMLTLMCVSVLADSPTGMLKTVANQMLGELSANKNSLQGNTALIHRIVNSVLVPHIDVNRMAGMVVGRHYWYSASAAERREFVYQFKRVVINTYANALESYNDDEVVINPMHGDFAGKFASVSSEIVRKTGQRIPINYKLINKGSWQVYDFSIENVSIVSNYRSQFAGVLANGGIGTLLLKLKQYNK